VVKNTVIWVTLGDGASPPLLVSGAMPATSSEVATLRDAVMGPERISPLVAPTPGLSPEPAVNHVVPLHFGARLSGDVRALSLFSSARLSAIRRSQGGTVRRTRPRR